MNREIPIITDDILANPEFGTGAVKVTPSHDPNDFEAGLRNDLPQIEVMNEVAQMNENAGPYKGSTVSRRGRESLKTLEQGGFLVGAKDYIVPLGKCDRCKTIIEPRLSTQWFVKIQPLADRAIEVVENGDIKFVPGELRQDVLRVDAQHSRLVHLAPVVVGPSHSGVALQGLQRDHRRARGADQVLEMRQHCNWSRTTTCSIPGSRRVCCPAPRWAGPTARRPRRVLPDDAADHQLRHPVLLGGAHDHDELPLHARPPTWRHALPERVHPRAGARRRGPEDVEDQGQRHRPDRDHRAVRHRRGALHAGRRWPRRAPT